MFLRFVATKVDSLPFELVDSNVANEAKVVIVVVHFFLLRPHACERVNDDSADDRGDDEVDEQHVCEVQSSSWKWDGSVIRPDRLVGKPVVDVHSKAVEQVVAAVFILEFVLSSDFIIEKRPYSEPIDYYEEK